MLMRAEHQISMEFQPNRLQTRIGT